MRNPGWAALLALGVGLFGCYYTDADLDGYAVETGDCDDENPEVNPGATELCNGVDDDCDGVSDEGSYPQENYAYYWPDLDLDGWGDDSGGQYLCFWPEGYAIQTDDCADDDPNVHPGAKEVCNGLDDDCDHEEDEGVMTTYHPDRDGDGYGSPDESEQACEPPDNDSTTDASDCDDNDKFIHPEAFELCLDHIDNDCSGVVDDSLNYPDADKDGYGQPGSEGVVGSCPAPAGKSTNDWDCDEADPNNFPYNEEICDGRDNNCDEYVDATYDGYDPKAPADALIWYEDADKDGHGCNPDNTDECGFIFWCTNPSDEYTTYVSSSDDCNDANPAVYSGCP